jgi:hypothetical protein
MDPVRTIKYVPGTTTVISQTNYNPIGGKRVVKYELDPVSS